MTPATSAITESLPASQQGVGSALNDLAREVGGALGTAVLGSIVTGVYASSLSLRGVPGPLADQARRSFAVAIHFGGPLGASAKTAFVDGIHAGLLYAAGAAVVAAVCVAVLLSPGRDRRASGGGASDGSASGEGASGDGRGEGDLVAEPLGMSAEISALSSTIPPA